MDSDFRIAVIGLGLIGGSMAYALRGFRNAAIVGCDIDKETRDLALKSRAVDEVYEDVGAAVDGADVIIFCTYPDIIQSLISGNASRFKSGAVISDVCGVKAAVSENICGVLPENVDYVGGHPMAGLEVDGFKNASPEMFRSCGYIITPTKVSNSGSVELIKEIAEYVGSERIAVASPEEHDKVIAYTSDLMHVSASALCLSYPEEMNRAYTAGSFRDCTRVARINSELWSGLLISNKENVIREIDRLSESLERIRTCIANSDREKLRGLLEQVCENKITMQKKEPK